MEKADYYKKKLELVIRDINDYTPDEYARQLLRLVAVANPLVMNEDEFTKARLQAMSQAGAPAFIGCDPGDGRDCGCEIRGHMNADGSQTITDVKYSR